jgi:hypothetical protein
MPAMYLENNYKRVARSDIRGVLCNATYHTRLLQDFKVYWMCY